MKKILFILTSILALVACKQDRPKSIQLEDPRTQICLTDSSILLPSFTTISKGENIEFITQLQLKKTVYIC